MTRLARLLVLAFLFVSGATGLVYEIVWSKHLANVLGNSGQAHALVLATFMGGLALGAWLFGGLADRMPRPLAMYGALEAGIGLLALAFPFLLGGLGALFQWIAVALPESLRLFPKLLLAALALLPPTLLMGGTLPALARHFTRELGGVQREVARLYAVNSLGAATGAFLAGVRWIPELGLFWTATTAALINLALAVAALALARRPAGERAEETAASSGSAGGGAAEEGAVAYPPGAIRAALIGVALSGFTAMLYEVTWIRLLAIVLGASTYAFTLILTAFILGIGVGSYWLSRRASTGDSLRLFGWLQLFQVLSICVAIPLYTRLPYLFLKASEALHRTPESWPWFQALTFAFCGLVLLVPTFFMGAGFPAVARVATSQVSSLGRRLGKVYLWNTGGTILGSLLGGLWLLPTIGLEGNFAVGLVLNVAAGALALRYAPSFVAEPPTARRWTLIRLGAVALCALVYLGASPGWSDGVVDAGTHREWRRTFSSYAEFREAGRRDAVVKFRKDDVFATVVVGERDGGALRYLRINGKVDGSNGVDAQTQVLAGHLGVLLHEREVKRVLLVGAGAAITAGSILAHPVERVDLVEISPAVIEAARLFAPDNRRALDDARLAVHIEDAKTFMALSKERYDLIVSVPSNPWVTGVSGLFSRDFFQVAREHLAPDGLVVQWIHTYASNEELVRLVFRTLRETFPHGTTWAGPVDLVLVAGLHAQEVDFARLEQRLARAEVAEDLRRVDLPDLTTLLAKQVHSDAGQGEFAGAGPVNTDDRNLLEYASPVAYFVAKSALGVHDERRSPNGSQRLWLTRYLQRRALSAVEAQHIHRNLSKSHTGDDPLVRSVAEAWYRQAPSSPEAGVALARAALEQEEPLLARRLLSPHVEGKAAAKASAELVATYLEAVVDDARRRRSLLHPEPADSVSAAFRLWEAAKKRSGAGSAATSSPRPGEGSAAASERLARVGRLLCAQWSRPECPSNP